MSPRELRLLGLSRVLCIYWNARAVGDERSGAVLYAQYASGHLPTSPDLLGRKRRKELDCIVLSHGRSPSEFAVLRCERGLEVAVEQTQTASAPGNCRGHS